MSKPNINLKYREQDGMMLPICKSPTAAKQINLWAGTAGWPWNTSERITRSDLRL